MEHLGPEKESQVIGSVGKVLECLVKNYGVLELISMIIDTQRRIDETTSR